MVQQAMTYIDETPDKKTRLKLLEVLRTVTEGKIYVECERASLTQAVSKMKEADGDVKGATEIMQDVQVETFGSMDKRAKVAFILEQLRLTLAVKDYTRAGIICKKVSTRFFKDEADDVQQLKLKYYQLMIELAGGQDPEARSLNTCRYYRSMYDTPFVRDDAEKSKLILANCGAFIILAPYDSEQSDLLERIYGEPKLKHLIELKSIIGKFRTWELILWKDLEKDHGAYLRGMDVFKVGNEEGEARWKELKDRTVEHNLRVLARYYTRVSISRLCELTDMPKDDAEEFLSKLVQTKTIFAKIDRPAGIIDFVKTKSPNEVLNDWSSNLSELMVLVEKTKHMIIKEEMMKEI
jgi:26S proteasome regulatory subunit N5